jgi:amidohydrolase
MKVRLENNKNTQYNLLKIDLKKLDDLKILITEIIDQKRTILEDIAKYLYENPELGSEEFKAFEKLTNALEQHGFTVEEGVYDMPTAFVARRCGKKDVPKVAVIAEYDALPGVGHGCGHNLISAAAIGAGIASGTIVEDLVGEILVVGTPAEEGRGPSGGSKIIMANNGFWDDISGVIMLHPGNAWGVGGQALGISGLTFEFKGQTSHAAASPH